MPRGSSLPERLRYLQPFRKKFAALPREELHEDSGGPPLFACFSKRIKGCSQAEAEKIIEDDVLALRNWLAEPPQENDVLQFAIGLFYIYSPAKLVKHLIEEAEKPPEPTLCLKMELPPGAKLRRVAGAGEEGMLTDWRGLSFCVSAIPEEGVSGSMQAVTTPRNGFNIAVTSVKFGEVGGTKVIRTGESWRGPFKQVDYMLLVPGGNVFARILTGKKVRDELNWDESKIEGYFHTIHVVTKQPTATSDEG